MDREQAKFILQSFRPDGADARAPEFAEALGMAAEDRDLGEWLAHERATDAAFAAILNEVEIPEDLRESIFSVLAQEAGDVAFDEADTSFAGALSSIRPPGDLREQILNAMQAESEGVVAMPQSAPRRVSKWLTGAAVAAAVVLGAFVALNVPTNGISPSVVEVSAVGFLEAEFSLDQHGSEVSSLQEYLSSNSLPSPNVLPAGLEQGAAIGCKKITISGKPASLICFQLKAGVVHLIVLKRADVEADLPAIADASCHGCKKSGWAVTSWRDQEHALFLLGKMKPETLSKVLF